MEAVEICNKFRENYFLGNYLKVVEFWESTTD